ncbi:17122_t:CDS:2 [Gigaspora margarita]|uniref:17122_t:CDS:1 n=1 Tax=Gigaspora margarita TaxID=4874 RepID=A0ABN7UUX0_GIGMA|nr:17122_t:CDS:2 [Gigaspora margarita]
MDIVINHLVSLSDCPVETVHSIIRRRTPKFFTADQLQKEARFTFQNREDNAFRQFFMFTKMYQERHLYPLIDNSSEDGIYTYTLPSLGYVITDRHLPRGFVTARKPFTNVLCDYRFCDCTNYTNYSNDGNVLSCGHGYLAVACKDALKESMTKDLGENKFIDENTESAIEDDSDNADTATGDMEMANNLLEQARKTFVEL